LPHLPFSCKTIRRRAPACRAARSARVAEVVRGVAARGFDVLVVDDCSSDRTGDLARQAGATVVRHDRNRGKGAALSTGFAWAAAKGYEAVVTLDGDGQHAPDEISRFVSAWRSTGADIIVGTRMWNRRGMPPARALTNWFMSLVLSSLAGRKLTDTQCGYRLIRTPLWPRLVVSTVGFDSESEMLVRACRLGLRVREVPVSTIYGDEVSSIRPFRDTVRWLRLLWRLARS
jgi:glycosyltransferase involved in cell wall biosynthesis